METFNNIVKSIFVVLLIYGIVLGLVWVLVIGENPNHTLQSGVAVTIINDVTEIRDGQVCLVVEKANIAYTGDNNLSWHRWIAGTLGFPTHQYHVIKPDGSLVWVHSNHILIFDPHESFCSPIP